MFIIPLIVNRHMNESMLRKIVERLCRIRFPLSRLSNCKCKVVKSNHAYTTYALCVFLLVAYELWIITALHCGIVTVFYYMYNACMYNACFSHAPVTEWTKATDTGASIVAWLPMRSQPHVQAGLDSENLTGKSRAKFWWRQCIGMSTSIKWVRASSSNGSSLR